MKIGLDIDNVVAAFDQGILESFLELDKQKRNRGIINPSGRWIADCFDWSREEVDEFFVLHMEDLAKRLEVRAGAREYMSRLLEDGHELYLITNRVYPTYRNPETVTLEWLEKNRIPYTKLVMTKTTNKTEECLRCGVDIMFDDNPENCHYLIEGGVRSCCVATDYPLEGKEGLDEVKDWEELYRYVCELQRR